MVMKRFLLIVTMITGSGAIGACDKPAADDCREAILNMEKLLGTDTTQTTRTGEIESEVRRCKGGSTREAVACAKGAATLAQLKACDFMGAKSRK
jgi:hypothetical protein